MLDVKPEATDPFAMPASAERAQTAQNVRATQSVCGTDVRNVTPILMSSVGKTP